MRLFRVHRGAGANWQPKGGEWEPIRESWSRLKSQLGFGREPGSGNAKAFGEGCRLKWPETIAMMYAALSSSELADQAFPLQLPEDTVKAVLTARQAGEGTRILPPGTWLYEWRGPDPPRVWATSREWEVVQSSLYRAGPLDFY